MKIKTFFFNVEKSTRKETVIYIELPLENWRVWKSQNLFISNLFYFLFLVGYRASLGDQSINPSIISPSKMLKKIWKKRVFVKVIFVSLNLSVAILWKVSQVQAVRCDNDFQELDRTSKYDERYHAICKNSQTLRGRGDVTLFRRKSRTLSSYQERRKKAFACRV